MNALSEKAKTYPCPECDSSFTDKSSMKKHIRSQHEGIKYPCNQCDYKATRNRNLQTHIQSKHEGIKYQCHHC